MQFNKNLLTKFNNGDGIQNTIINNISQCCFAIWWNDVNLHHNMYQTESILNLVTLHHTHNLTLSAPAR